MLWKDWAANMVLEFLFNTIYESYKTVSSFENPTQSKNSEGVPVDEFSF